MIVIDTSVWIEFFRGRDVKLCAHFERLLDDDRVALPAPVRVEILGGVRKTELPKLKRVMEALPLLVPSALVWSTIETWLSRAAGVGQHFDSKRSERSMSLTSTAVQASSQAPADSVATTS